MKILFSILSMFVLISCASETAKMAHKINHDKDYIFYKKSSVKCRNAINRTDEEDVIFNSRIVATPIIGILGIFAAPAVLAANVALDARDRINASNLSVFCGGNGIKNEKIAGDVLINGSIGLVLQGSNLSVYPGGEQVPVSTAAEVAN